MSNHHVCWSIFFGISLLLYTPFANSENYLSTLCSEMLPEFDELPPAVQPTFLKAMETEATGPPARIADEYQRLSSIPHDNLSDQEAVYFDLRYALALEASNRHPEAIAIMRTVLSDKHSDANADRISYFLRLEIARVMAQCGDSPHIPNFAPTIEEIAAAHYEVFRNSEPYDPRILMAHLDFALEANFAAERYPLLYGNYLGIALQELQLIQHSVMAMKNNPELITDTTATINIDDLLQYAIANIPRLEKQIRSATESARELHLLQLDLNEDDGVPAPIDTQTPTHTSPSDVPTSSNVPVRTELSKNRSYEKYALYFAASVFLVVGCAIRIRSQISKKRST